MYAKFSSVYTLYHTTTALTVPPSDGTNGGDAKYDIYISGDIAGAYTYGYVQPESNIGNNPNSTSITEVDAYSSYMVMRNNYTGFGDENIAMSVTAAHEYMHATQMGYTGTMDVWFMEACATWSEDYAFPGYDDNFQYLSSIFETPDLALNLEDGEASGAFDGHWYGVWLFMKYMTDHTGNNIIKNIYERCISYYAIDAMNNELVANWSSNFNLFFTQYTIANALMTSNSNYSPYTYSRANDYNTYITNNIDYTTEKDFNYTGSNIDFNSQTNSNSRLMRLSSDYFNLSANKNFKITFTPSTTSAEFDIMLIKVGANSIQIQSPEHTATQSILNVTDNSSWNKYIPIVYRINKTVTNTTSLNYTINITNTDAASIENINSEFNIYPNPANGFVNISSNLFSNYEVSISDLTGKKVLTQNLINQNNTIDVQDLNNGIYYLKLINNNKIIKTEKIIISH